MTGERFVINRATFRDQILRGPGVERVALSIAERALERAGEGHEVEMYRGRNRWRATVRTTTVQAGIAEAAHQNLTRAIRAGGESA